MTADSRAAALARFFLEERGIDPSELLTHGDAPARSVLGTLLTTREPLPIRDDIAAELDELLAEEAAHRAVVEASGLPTLAEQGRATGSFGERVRLWQGDLTLLRADAIVNAANNRMLGCFIPGHRCIDNVIHAVAGPRLRAECAAHMDAQGHPEPTGSATLTAGYHLPASYVIHTVGPRLNDGAPSTADEAALASSYRSILDTAHTHGGIRTVGFCAISTGVFGYPKAAAARVAVAAIREWLATHPDSPLQPLISAFTADDNEHYLAALESELHA